jgi:hypothetical protein
MLVLTTCPAFPVSDRLSSAPGTKAAAALASALKAEFADGVDRYLKAFAAVVPDTRGEGDARQTAILVISTLIGALMLSRTCARVNKELSDEILAVVRAQLLQD